MILTPAVKSFGICTSPKIYQYSTRNQNLSISNIKGIKPKFWESVELPNFGRGGGYGRVKFGVKNEIKNPLYLEIVGHFKENLDIWLWAIFTGIMLMTIYRQNLILRNQQHLVQENKLQQIAIYDQTINELKYQQNLKLQRERIARDLHDGIGSQLSHIIGQIDLLSLRDKNQRELVLLGEFTRETNQTLRDSIWVLNKEAVYGVDFKQRLTGYIARICCDVEIPLVSHAFSLPDNLMLSPQITSYLFYIIQEALNNTLKYADAQIVQITMYQKDKKLMLFFEDNGKGFDTANLSMGYGLSNIKKRVEELDGIFSVHSTNLGTFLNISIPFKENSNENTPFGVLTKAKQIENFGKR